MSAAELQFSSEVFGNFSKVYVFVVDLAAKKNSVDLDRLLFIFE